MNCTALLVPPAVVTVTLRTPGIAFDAIENVAVAVVDFKTCTLVTVTPVPATVTAVRPASSPVPVNVTGIELPATPLLGVICAKVGTGGGGAVTVKAAAFEVPPPGLVTVTWTIPAAPRVTVTTIVVPSLETDPATLVEPKFTIAPETKFDPVNVNVIVAPAVPVAGDSPPRVGVAFTVNVAVPLVPPTVLTLTPRAPAAAVGLITNVANSDVLLATKTPVPVTPVPVIVRAVAPATKFVPVRATLTFVP